MGIFDQNSFDTARNTNNRTAKPAAQDRPAAKVWLNVGYMAGDRFVTLPVGIPIDTMEAVPVRGQNDEWLEFQTARNDLLKALQEGSDQLEAGEEREIHLVVKLRKNNDEKKVVGTNQFSTDLTSIFGSSPDLEKVDA